MNNTEFKNLNFSLLGKASELEGDFKFSGDTLINCKMKGKINITGNTISTTDNSPITVTTGMNFNGGISGSPVAMSYFLTSKT